MNIIVNSSVTFVTLKTASGKIKSTAVTVIVPVEISNAMKDISRRMSTKLGRRKEKKNCQDVSSITSVKTVINYWILQNDQKKNISVMSGCVYAAGIM